MSQLTNEELWLIKNSLAHETSLIRLYRAASQNTDDPVLRGKWEEYTAQHIGHRDVLRSFLEQEGWYHE